MILNYENTSNTLYHKKVDKRDIEDIYDLTPMQTGMLYRYLRDPYSDFYFEQMSYRLKGNIKLDLIAEAWNSTARANEVLRAVFRWIGLRQPVQIILKNHEIPVRNHDYSGAEEADWEQLLDDMMLKDRKEGINLSLSPLRVTLCKLKDKEYEMLVSYHHIICDGWSNALLMKEFLQIYSSLLNDKEIRLPAKNRYKEYIKWCKGQGTDKQKAYWKRYLEGSRQNGCFVSKTEGSAAETSAKAFMEYVFEDNLVGKIGTFTEEIGVTQAVLFYAAFCILIYIRYTSEDIIFGTTVSGRPPEIKGIEKMTGLFINTLPLRVKLSPKATVPDLLNRIEKMMLERQEYESAPLMDLMAIAGLSGKEKLFDQVVVIQNYPLDSELLSYKKDISLNVRKRFYMTDIGLTLSIRTFDGIVLEISYATDYMKEYEIHMLKDLFIQIVSEIVSKKADLNKATLEQFKCLHIIEEEKFTSSIRNSTDKLNELGDFDF